MKNIKLSILFIVLLVSGCRSLQDVNPAEQNTSTLYQHAIEEAMSPSQQKVYPHLVAITPDNKALTWKTIQGENYLLVVSWKQNVTYYQPYLDSCCYNTGDYPIWVSTAPELLERMQQEDGGDIKLRLKQLLGLPPDATYNYFVEFWVKPEDLFRPCPDNEITDSQCDLCFPTTSDEAYISWINENRISRYYQCELNEKYPWTQLGYTYDWNPENELHVGVSEFVIGHDKQIYVNAIYTTEAYLNKEM